MIQQEYDNELVIFSYMAEVNQVIAAILHILPLLLEGSLGMNVSHYFCSSYTIGTEGCQWDSTLDKVIHIGIDNSFVEIDRYWLQYIDAFTMRNKYKKEEHGGYIMNGGSFYIAEALGGLA